MEYLIALFAFAALAAHVRLSGTELIPTGPVQYFLHKLYAIAEPTIMRIVDYLITRKLLTGTLPGRFMLKTIAVLSHYFPHGLILTTTAAERFLEYIDTVEGPRGARIAVGPCVCQRALDRWQEPSCKDIVVLYSADIYYHLNLGYRIISSDEAKKLLRQCRDAGLVHSLDFCLQSGKWTFVVCNCDRDICVLYRIWNITGEFLYPGPEIAVLDGKRCKGEKKCGLCVGRCMFGAITATGSEPSFNPSNCMGCGQCVITCRGKARSMKPREDFRHGTILPLSIVMPSAEKRVRHASAAKISGLNN
jgi:NAD-dependent dihydropyrimidine dehydrogenase PreA subunit